MLRRLIVKNLVNATPNQVKEKKVTLSVTAMRIMGMVIMIIIIIIIIIIIMMTIIIAIIIIVI